MSGRSSPNTPGPPNNIPDDDVFREMKPAIGINGYFRFSNKMVHLTYAYQFDIDKYLLEMAMRIENKGASIQYYSIVKENGRLRSTGESHPHTHVALSLSRPITVTNPRFFDFRETTDIPSDIAHCHVRIIRAKQHWDHVCNVYHKKEGNPHTNYIPTRKNTQPTTQELQACKTSHDVLCMMAEKGQSLKTGPALKAWEHCRQETQISMGAVEIERPYPWQRFLENAFNYKLTENRTFFWIANERGRMGKTVFSEYMMVKYNGIVFTTLNINDCMRVLVKHVKERGFPSIMFIDIARPCSVHKVYALLEKLKARIMTSGKYDSSTIQTDIYAMVVVLSNNIPDISTLTEDRWIICVPRYNGTNFKYIFAGSEGREFLNRYTNIEETNHWTAVSDGKVYYRCPPSDYVLDFEDFDEAIKYITRDIEDKFLDRHKIPFVGREAKQTGVSSLTLLVRDMTESEIEEYEQWKRDKITVQQKEKRERDRERIIAAATERFKREVLPFLPDIEKKE